MAVMKTGRTATISHRRWRLAAWCAAIMLLAGGAAALAAAPAEAITAVLNAQTAAWNRGDLEAFMQGYWNSPEVVFTSRGQVRRGWRTTLNSYRAHYGTSPASMGRLEFSDLEIHDLAPDAAWVLGRWTLTGGDSASTGVFTLIFRRLDGDWRIVMDHSSATRPAPAGGDGGTAP
jgi:uncharacterized protein (TIGR02246 family)